VKLSKQTQYGLQILLQLARRARTSQLATGKQIARQQSVNEPYVEQLVAPLKRGGLVQTVRGRHGGYTLGKAPGQITVLDIIESFEGSLELVNDDNRTANGEGVEIVWRHLAAGLREAAADITLASILENQNEGMPDYII
jgi:Rrf2 family cysteine metabolism transcriptional repressor